MREQTRHLATGDAEGWRGGRAPAPISTYADVVFKLDPPRGVELDLL